MCTVYIYSGDLQKNAQLNFVSTMAGVESCLGSHNVTYGGNCEELDAFSKPHEQRPEDKRPDSLTFEAGNSKTLESPKTPSNIYTKSVIGGIHPAESTSHYIQYFVLSFWDNIVGPRTAHVWKTNDEIHLSRPVLQSIATRSLGGELSHGSLHSNIDMKILMLKKDNTVVYSYIFEALGGILHSLSFVIGFENNQKILAKQDIIMNHMHTLVGKLRIVLCRVSIGILLHSHFHTCIFIALYMQAHDKSAV